MRAGNRHSPFGALTDLLACFLLPAYTLVFAGSRAWFGTNFSVLAVTGEGHYRGFLLWGLLAGACYAALLGPVTAALSGFWLRAGVTLILMLAEGCLAWAVLIPYLPERLPRYARLHVALAMAACVLLMGAMLGLILCRRRGLLPAWLAVAGGSGALLVLGGMVTTALEVFFTLTSLWLARRLRRQTFNCF